MSEPNADDVDAGEAIALAVEFLEGHRESLSVDRGRGFEKKIDQWKERQADLDEGDPLYGVAEERIQEYESKLEQHEMDTENLEREVLEVVSEGFMADGEWLDDRLFRALNLILFDKYSDTLVVQRTVLDENAEFEDDDLYAVSRAVRDLAREQLESRR